MQYYYFKLQVCFSASPAKSSLNVGNTTTLTITANDCLGQFTISSSDSSVVSVSDSAKWIENASSTITLTAKKTGKATITVKAANVSDTAGEHDITGSKSVTITVTEPAPAQQPQNNSSSNNNNNTSSKSSDATLKSVTVDGKNYSLGTTMTVNADVSSVEIKATPKSSKAKVSGTGRKDLVTGTNRFNLTVTAENGATKNYTVKITKLAEQNDTPNVVEENPPEENNEQELKLNSLVIDGVTLEPEFKSDVFEYSVSVQDLEKLIINATPSIEDANVEITGNEDLAQGENVVLIKLTKDDKTVEYKIVVNKTIAPEVEEEEPPKEEENDEEKKVGFIGMITDWWNKSGPMTIVFSSVLILLGTSISFAIIAYKYGGTVKKASKHDSEESI